MTRASARRLGGALAVLVVLSGCERSGGANPEVRARKEIAFRQACVARQLERASDEDVELLEETLNAADPADPLGAIVVQTTRAALDFSRAFQRHAELRAVGYAYLDSAVNHSRTSADSVRYLGRAESFAIRAPRPGTIEANVLMDYQEKFAAALDDENNRCNWDLPF